MVALSIMACTHDMSAHTSYLFIVKDHYLNWLHFANQCSKRKTLPGAEAGRLLYMLSLITVNNIPSNFPNPVRSDAERTRIIGRGFEESTVDSKIIEISFSKP